VVEECACERALQGRAVVVQVVWRLCVEVCGVWRLCVAVVEEAVCGGGLGVCIQISRGLQNGS